MLHGLLPRHPRETPPSKACSTSRVAVSPTPSTSPHNNDDKHGRSEREVHQWFGGDTYGLSATYQGVGDKKFEMVAAVYQDRDR